MSDPLETNHLKLPYLAAAQAQKHVTHNEALRRLDSIVQLAVLDTSLTAPPGSPAEGDRYIVATGGTGDWDGKDGDIATFVDGAWEFAEPDDGWLAFDLSSETILACLSGAWEPASAAPSLVDFLGINATADTTNRLAVRSEAVLFSGIEVADGGTGDIRFTVNKETAADTASLLFQRGWSGRAEVGLVGDDDFVFKVSPDGAAWTEAIRIDKDTGLAAILYDNGASGLAATNVQDAIDEIVATDVASVFGRTGAVVAATSDYDASQVDNDSGVSGSTVKDALNTLNAGKAALASPALTGTPAAPTAAVDTNTTQLATTAFVLGQASASGDGTPAANGTAARGSSTHFARADHVHPTDTSRAALASPALTGTPTLPTAAVDTNTTQAASTAFVIGQAASANPVVDGTAAPGTATRFARADHVHPTDTSLAPVSALAQNSLVINGGMEVDQEFAGAATTLTGTGTVQHTSTVDGWCVGYSGAMILALQQVADAPPGFRNSLKMTVSTADASMAAGDVVVMTQAIEGTRVAKLGWGAAGAQPVSWGFWVKAHRTGSYSGSIKNAAGNRAYPFSLTVSLADTWEFKTVTIAGDTTGTWPMTTGVGMYISICIASGSTLLGTANAWAASNLDGVTGTINGVAATTDVFQLTGVILLAGSLLPTSALSPLLMRPFDQEQRTCQRYCVTIRSGNLIAFGKCYTTTAAFVTLSLPVPLRIDPTVTLSAASDFNLLKTGATAQAVTSLLASAGGIESAILQLNFGVASGLTVDMATAVQRANSNAVILINARLLG